MMASKAKKGGQKEAEEAPAVMEVVDAETGEKLSLNKLVFGTGTSQAEQAAQGVESHAKRAPRYNSVAEIKAAHAQELADFIAREAAREELRKALLHSELSGWRRDVMKKSFLQERLQAAKDLAQLKVDHEVGLTRWVRYQNALNS